METEHSGVAAAAESGAPATRGTLRGRRLVLLFASAFLALLAVLAVAFARGSGGAPQGDVPAASTVASDFTLPTFAGGTFRLSEHEDRPTLVFFWASWCVPCQEEAPVIQRLWPEYEQRGYRFVGVNITDAEKDARRFIDEYGFTFPVVRDTKGTVYLEYGVAAVSEAFFLRPGRQVESRFIGALKEQDLRARLDALQRADR